MTKNGKADKATVSLSVHERDLLAYVLTHTEGTPIPNSPSGVLYLNQADFDTIMRRGWDGQAIMEREKHPAAGEAEYLLNTLGGYYDQTWPAD